ncbi:MAG TPA: ATP-binding domain-containing protein, partial [Acidimicrobiales bacterium]
AAVQQSMLRYRAALDVGARSLCFGRIDEDRGDRWYIGRRHVEDDRGQPVVVDWRAGVATPFYRATFADPLGLERRRRFALEGRTIVDLFDEDFADPASAHGASGIPDPLLAELDRSRTGAMRDIVATIQAEQDVVIRAPLDLLLIVQGGPGTGKTAVGLHRAALLLYDHREYLDREGVLVVGPNRLFLRYISQVLPSLGETSVVQTTIAGLGEIDVRADEPDDVARLKGDARMAEVIARAAWGRTVPLVDDVAVRTSFGGLTLRADDVNAALDAALADRRTVTSSRDGFRAAVVRLAFERLVARRPEGLKLSDEVASAVRTSVDLKRALDRAWPATTAPALVRRLLTNRAALAAAADGILTPAEQRLLVRRAARRADDEPWTAADVALVDEADAVLGARPRRYGHIVVDEAQDLSAMALRMLQRRGARFPSMTILGDLAQSTAPGGQASWDDVLAALGRPDAMLYAELDIGYRVPGQILDVANLLLPGAGVDVAAARSARRTDDEPRFVTVDDDGRATAVVDVVTELAGRHPTVGVIAPAELHPSLLEAGLPVGEALAAPVSLITPSESKGLEFDAVVVVEPAMVAAAGPPGVRLLYVAMTRAVQHLTVVQSEPLAALAAA